MGDVIRAIVEVHVPPTDKQEDYWMQVSTWNFQKWEELRAALLSGSFGSRGWPDDVDEIPEDIRSTWGNGVSIPDTSFLWTLPPGAVPLGFSPSRFQYESFLDSLKHVRVYYETRVLFWFE